MKRGSDPVGEISSASDWVPATLEQVERFVTRRRVEAVERFVRHRKSGVPFTVTPMMMMPHRVR
jgi:hypothetical protein